MENNNAPVGGLKRNIISNMCGQAILMVLSLVSTHLVFHKLGADVLGVIYFSLTVTFVLIILSDMGLSPTVTREIAAHRHNDSSYVSDLVGSSSVIAWIAYGSSCFLIVLFSPFLIKHWLQIGTIGHHEAIISFAIISAALLLAIPRVVYGAIIAGHERMDMWNVANVAAVGVQQLGMIVVLALGGTLYAVAVWYGVSGIVGLVIFCAVASRLSGISPWHLSFRSAVIRRNFHFGSRLFANTMVGYLVGQVDKWIISKFLPASTLGYYGVAQGLVSKGSMVPGTIAAAAFPALSTGVGNKDRSGWMGQYLKLQDFTCYVYFPVTGAVAMLGIVVIRYVFNNEIAELIWRPLLLLAISQYALGLLTVPFWLAVAFKRPDISLRTNIWALLLVVPITVVLVYRYGLIGAAASSVLYAAWQLFYFIPRFCSECLGTSALLWYRHAGTFSAIGLIAYGLPWIIAWTLGEGLTLMGLVSAYFVGTFAFTWIGWLQAGPGLQAAVRQSVKVLKDDLGG